MNFKNNSKNDFDQTKRKKLEGCAKESKIQARPQTKNAGNGKC